MGFEGIGDGGNVARVVNGAIGESIRSDAEDAVYAVSEAFRRGGDADRLFGDSERGRERDGVGVLGAEYMRLTISDKPL